MLNMGPVTSEQLSSIVSHSPPLPASADPLSLQTGWMSIALWIVVFTPQIYENYFLQSGDGLSVTFIVLWLAGDLTNSLGSIMAHLLPTMIVLGVYVSSPFTQYNRR